MGQWFKKDHNLFTGCTRSPRTPFQNQMLYYYFMFTSETSIFSSILWFYLFPGAFEFTWQQFMIGVQSSLIMFPVNILIVSIFRNTRPRETSCCRRKAEKPHVPQPSQTLPNNSNVTLEAVIKVGSFPSFSSIFSFCSALSICKMYVL